jgi:hypothetical protein
MGLLLLMTAAGFVLAGAFLGACLAWASKLLFKTRLVLWVLPGILLGGVGGYFLFDTGLVSESYRSEIRVHWHGMSLYDIGWAPLGIAVLGPVLVGLAALRRRRTG